MRIRCFEIALVALCSALASDFAPRVTLGQECQVATLLHPEAGIGSSHFGVSIATDGDLAIVGANGGNSGICAPGSAHLFRRTGPGTTWQEEQVLSAPDATSGDYFGGSVGVIGDVAVVGAPGHDGQGPGAGSAYIFRHDGMQWLLEQQLIPAGGAAGRSFGVTVAIGDGVAAIGAPGDFSQGGSSGAVHVFRRTGTVWVEQAMLVASDAAAGRWFGASVSLREDAIAVGAPRLDSSSPELGTAYIFRDSAGVWIEEQKISALDGTPGDRFGVSVSLAADLIVAGAVSGDGLLPDTGAAYVFRRSGGIWAQEAKLEAVGGQIGGGFGAAVATDGGVAVVGVAQTSTLTFAVYVFRFLSGGWTGQAVLDPSGFNDNFFGGSVGLSGDGLLVGAPLDDATGDSLGAVFPYAFDAGQWLSQPSLRPAPGADGDRFGQSVALEGDHAAVGAPLFSGAASSEGGVFTYRRFGTDWVEVQTIQSPAASQGRYFGIAASLSGDALAVGSQDPSTVEIFRFDGAQWLPEASFPVGHLLLIGTGVGIDGDVVVVGSPYGSPYPPMTSGAISIHRRVAGSWGLDSEFSPSDLSAGAMFGSAVDVKGSRVIAGAPSDAPAGVGTGSAYLFSYDGSVWSEEQKLTPWDGTFTDAFGEAVAIDGTVAVVGAPGNDSLGTSAGAAYVFRRIGGVWTGDQKLLAWDGTPGDSFGRSVAIDGGRILVGASFADGESGVAGAGYTFRYQGGSWIADRKIAAAGGATGDEFAYALALDGDTVLAGAHRSDEGCLPVECSNCDSGSAQIFDLASCPPIVPPSPYTLRLTDGSGPPLGTASVSSLLDIASGATSIAGWSLGVCHDASAARPIAAANGATTLTAKNGAPVDFSILNLDSAGGVVHAAIICFVGCATLAAGTGYELIEITYQLLAESGTETVISYCDDAAIPGSPTTPTLVVTAFGFAADPERLPGTLTIRSRFVRGDCNSDFAITLADPVFALHALFAGGDAPSCVDACDLDDDGIWVISDAVFGLMFLFAGGEFPPAPFPGCGADPSADGLPCAETACD